MRPDEVIEFQAAMAQETLALHFESSGDSDDLNLLWRAYRATLLIVVQSCTFVNVTEQEQEAVVRRLASRYVQEWDTTSTRISDGAREGLQALREDFDISRPTAKWTALTVGVERAFARWHAPRKIRLNRPWAYWTGQVPELPLLALGEVGLVEHRYRPDQNGLESVEGFPVFANDVRRRIIGGAESWLEEYRRNPGRSLERANLTAADRSPNGQPNKSRYASILKDPKHLKREQRHLYLLLIAADHRRPDSEQSQAAKRLVAEVFSWPVYAKRWPDMLERARSVDDARVRVRKAAEKFLLEGVWEAGHERAWDGYSEIVTRLRRFLNAHVTEALLGPKWRGLTENRDDQTQERLLDDLAAEASDHSKSSKQGTKEIAQLEAAVSAAGSLCYEAFESNLRERELRDELAVFLRKTTDGDRALWAVMLAVQEDEGRINVSEGYRRFVRRYPELPPASSESTFRRRWSELEGRLERWLAAG